MLYKYLIPLLLLAAYNVSSHCGFRKIENEQHKHESLDALNRPIVQSFYHHVRKHHENRALNGKFKEELVALVKLLCKQSAREEFCPQEIDLRIYRKGYLETSFWGSQSKPYIAFVDEGFGKFWYVLADENVSHMWKIVCCRRNIKVHTTDVYTYNLKTKQLKITNQPCPIHSNRSLFGW